MLTIPLSTYRLNLIPNWYNTTKSLITAVPMNVMRRNDEAKGYRSLYQKISTSFLLLQH
jgi:hypothetical protein